MRNTSLNLNLILGREQTALSLKNFTTRTYHKVLIEDCVFAFQTPVLPARTPGTAGEQAADSGL